MHKYIMSIDAGTTSVRCILFDRNRQPVSVAKRELSIYYPEDGWVEQDPDEIWSFTMGAITEALTQIGAEPEEIDSIAIANQRETTILWDSLTGKPVYRAIVWQCRRTAPFCNELREQGHASMISAKTGLVVDPYFCASKIRWILDNCSVARELADAGRLMFGTVDCWLMWHLTGRKSHVTDCTNASRTMLYNIHSMEWDSELIQLFGLSNVILPQVLPCSAEFGVADIWQLNRPIPICGVAGDQQAALFGEECFEPGDVKNTYGTGGFLLMNTGDTSVQSTKGLITSIAWQIGDKVSYCLEGSVFVAGAAIKWLRDKVGLIEKAGDTEEIALKAGTNGGCYLVPALSGLGAPYWDPSARGVIVGLTGDTDSGHIVRATLESLAYQVQDVLNAMEQDSGYKITALKADGGAADNQFLLQFQSDISNVPVSKPMCIETTALGAAMLAGIYTGFYDFDQFKSEVEKEFMPTIDQGTRENLLSGWHKAVDRAKGWS